MIFERIFLTVGTTEFDQLIETIDSSAFAACLQGLGCRLLILQIGRGAYEPKTLPDDCARLGIRVEVFRFKPTLDREMKAADLIISHCGAGSILESLTLQKVFVVVVNDTLQGNHQEELATALAEEGYCHSTVPDELCGVLNSSFTSNNYRHKLFPETDYDLFPSILDDMFGFGHEK